jgi:uncharacterized cupredoxin-like copper-binding protein
VTRPFLAVPARLARGAAALTISVAFLTACGNDSTDAAAGGTTAGTTTQSSASSAGAGAPAGQTESITATEADFSISLDKDTFPAGTYEITVVNKGHATHDLVVERNGNDVEKTTSIAPGKTATLTVPLESGKYVFYCSIGNHRQMGMETTVTVS